MTRTPAVGDTVIFEGLAHRLTRLEDGHYTIESELRHEQKPRFTTMGNTADLLWSARLGAWYVWGRVLGKGRGAVGPDQRVLAAQLRDFKAIPSRPTRERGQVPAAGEQHGLFADLFAGAVDWEQEIANLRRGEGLSENAVACTSAHASGFRTKRLNHGFAARDDGDPGFESITGDSNP